MNITKIILTIIFSTLFVQLVRADQNVLSQAKANEKLIVVETWPHQISESFEISLRQKAGGRTFTRSGPGLRTTLTTFFSVFGADEKTPITMIEIYRDEFLSSNYLQKEADLYLKAGASTSVVDESAKTMTTTWPIIR